MGKATKIISRFIKDKNGSGAVEYLIVIAAVGLIATAIFASLQGSLTEGEENATEQVGNGITEMIKAWEFKKPVGGE